MQWLGVIVAICGVAYGAFKVVGLARADSRQAAKVGIPFAVAVLVAVVWGPSLLGEGQSGRIFEMLGAVAVSVAVCIGIWIGLNVFVSQATRGWSRFAGAVGALGGAAFFGILRGNLVVDALVADPDPLLLGAGTGTLGLIEWPLIGALVFGGGALAMKSLARLEARVAIGAGVAVVAAVLIAPNTKIWQRPLLDWPNTIIATLVLGALGAALGWRSGRQLPGALLGAGAGFGVGAWLLSPFLQTAAVPWLHTLVPLILIMAALAWSPGPGPKALSEFESRARAVVFIGPALLFLLIALVVPAIRTAILSFKDSNGNEFVGTDNYERLFTAKDSFDTSKWQNMFTSQLFYAALILVAIAAIVAVVSGIRRNGTTSWDSGPTSTGALMLALFLFSFAALSVLRGTFFNNLWWVITVVTVATIAGLAIAVLADRAAFGENVAKSLIFMPMAVSFVGASIVWRLQYQARDIRKNQTGVLNAVWVALGRLSNSGLPRVIVMVVLAALAALLLWRIVGKARAGESFTLAGIGAFVSGWLLYRFAGPRLGGFQTDQNGEIVPQTVQFITERPFNNVFLMIILIWMQTGFAMVIFSAAIKAVPSEFLEAAKVDGASESDTFFRVTLPTIMPTVGVVVTTMIVQVTKVYDIVAVAGLRGSFGNDVLANQMFDESFQIGNTGFGAAIAIMMLLLVLPVMVYNIYQMQKEAI